MNDIVKDDIKKFRNELEPDNLIPRQTDTGIDEYTADDLEQYSHEKLREKQLNNRDKEQDINMRREYANYTLIGVAVWMICILNIVVCDGFHYFGFELSDSVLIALITTATAHLLIVLMIIYRYVFKKYQ